MNASLILWVYGAITALVGVSAFISKKSLISLIAGVVAGAILIGAGALLRSGKEWAFWLGVVVTIALLGRFAPGFFRTQDIWPGGAMTILSIAALIGLFIARRV